MLDRAAIALPGGHSLRRVACSKLAASAAPGETLRGVLARHDGLGTDGMEGTHGMDGRWGPAQALVARGGGGGSDVGEAAVRLHAPRSGAVALWRAPRRGRSNASARGGARAARHLFAGARAHYAARAPLPVSIPRAAGAFAPRGGGARRSGGAAAAAATGRCSACRWRRAGAPPRLSGGPPARRRSARPAHAARGPSHRQACSREGAPTPGRGAL